MALPRSTSSRLARIALVLAAVGAVTAGLAAYRRRVMDRNDAEFRARYDPPASR